MEAEEVWFFTSGEEAQAGGKEGSEINQSL